MSSRVHTRLSKKDSFYIKTIDHPIMNVNNISVNNKIFSVIFSSFLLTACGTSLNSAHLVKEITPSAELKEIMPAVVIEKEVQVNTTSYRIQKQAAKSYVRSDLLQYMNIDQASLQEAIPNNVNLFESKSPQLLKQLKEVLTSAKLSQVSIVHFGDSHVQLGVAQQITRDYLQGIFGDGGRGLIFPYSIAKTYSQNDYVSRFTGNWQYASSIQEYPKIPLGVGGFVAKTEDLQSSFTMSFNAELPKNNNRIQILYRVRSGKVPVTFYVDNYQYSDVLVPSANNSVPNLLSIDVKDIRDTIHVVFENVQGDKNPLELYGVNIQSSDNNGLVYHNAGVGGANYGAIPAQSYFETQLGTLNPSVVVLDYGTNDILYKNQVASTLEATIINTITKVRTAQPNALIVMMPPQDMFFKGRDITSANDLTQLLRRIALQNNCLFYDWYRISGGRGAMKTWVSYGLGRADHIHLTEKGYALKGYLLAKAFENSVNDINTAPPSFELKDRDAYSVSNWLKASSMPTLNMTTSTATTSKVSKQATPIQKTPASNSKKSQATIKTN